MPQTLDKQVGNMGTTATCNVQAAVFQFGIVAVPSFNVLYAVFSLLMVRYQWKEDRIRHIEPRLQLDIWMFFFKKLFLKNIQVKS